MPTFEYECKKCNYKFEEFQMMGEKPISKCPQCKGQLQKLISGGAGILFKGSGFYVTDSKSNKSKTNKKNEKSKETA